MRSIGSFEAKTHLSALLASVEAGDSFLITKHGRPVAKLVPAHDARDYESIQKAVDGLIEFRKSHPLRGITIRELIDEGRR